MTYNERFPETRRTPHFVLHYALRSHYVYDSPGAVRHAAQARSGVYDHQYVLEFAEALEESWQYYFKHGWDVPEKVDVWFRDLHVDGQTILRPLGIMLASRHEDPAGPCNMARVRATAAHELFHVVQARYRERCFYDEDLWAWFSEATAVFMQKEVFPQDLEHLRCLYRWFDEPDKPLDQRPNGSREYGGVVFCDFLCDKYRGKLPDANLLREIWSRAAEFDSPLKAIEECLRGHLGSSICLASADKADLFAEEFLLWNFFLDAHPHGYARGKLYQEKFQHAFADRVFPGKAGDRTSWMGGALRPLAARYHIVQVPEGSNAAKMALELHASENGGAPGKAVVCPVTASRIPIHMQSFPIYANQFSTRDRYTGSHQIDISDMPELRYLLVVVANTQWDAGATRPITEYKVTVEFK